MRDTARGTDRELLKGIRNLELYDSESRFPTAYDRRVDLIRYRVGRGGCKNKGPPNRSYRSDCRSLRGRKSPAESMGRKANMRFARSCFGPIRRSAISIAKCPGDIEARNHAAGRSPKRAFPAAAYRPSKGKQNMNRLCRRSSADKSTITLTSAPSTIVTLFPQPPKAQSIVESRLVYPRITQQRSFTRPFL